MSLLRYPSYKLSGIDWLGEVPEGWQLISSRRLFAQVRDPAAVDDEQLSATQKSGVLPQRLYMEQEDQKVVLALAGLGNFKHVEPGDFVISLRSFQGGIEHSAYRGCVSPAYTVLRPRKDMHQIYFKYLLKDDDFIAKLQSVTTGIRDGRNVSYEQFGVVPLPLPPLSEQQAIAAFLDRETAKIDALVEEQKRLIELLKEKRQAVITQTVTKGLNPNAPMKPSGVDWLGDVPEHWEVTSLKWMVTHVVDCLHTTPHYDGELLYPSIRTADLERGVLLLDQARLVCEDVYLERIQRLEPMEDDILYSREGERFGMAALVPQGAKVCLGQRMMMFRLSAANSPKYFMWLLNSDVVFNQVLSGVSGATSPHINISEIINYAIPKPPSEEQEEIGAMISFETGKIDELLSEAETAIALQQERRAALISAAVTGKIDVRGIATEQEAA